MVACQDCGYHKCSCPPGRLAAKLHELTEELNRHFRAFPPGAIMRQLAQESLSRQVNPTPAPAPEPEPSPFAPVGVPEPPAPSAQQRIVSSNITATPATPDASEFFSALGVTPPAPLTATIRWVSLEPNILLVPLEPEGSPPYGAVVTTSNTIALSEYQGQAEGPRRP